MFSFLLHMLLMFWNLWFFVYRVIWPLSWVVVARVGVGDSGSLGEWVGLVFGVFRLRCVFCICMFDSGRMAGNISNRFPPIQYPVEVFVDVGGFFFAIS